MAAGLNKQSLTNSPAPPCQPETVVTYVPPKAEKILSAIFYFPWHNASAECTSPAGSRWCEIFWLKPGNPRPLQGYYGSNDPATADHHMAWLAQYGIDVVAVEWTGEQDLINNFEAALLPAIGARNRKFVMLYDLGVRFRNLGLDFGKLDVRQQFAADMAAFASDPKYFQHPNYLKLDGKPVIYIYITRAIYSATMEEGHCQGLACIEEAFSQARQAARSAGFNDVYIVADHLWWIPDYSLLPLIGAQAATAFGPVVQAGHPECPDCPDITDQDQQPPVKTWADLMAQQLYESARPHLSTQGNLVDVTPGVFVQFDNTGVATGYGLQTYHLRDVSDWSCTGPRFGGEVVPV